MKWFPGGCVCLYCSEDDRSSNTQRTEDLSLCLSSSLSAVRPTFGGAPLKRNRTQAQRVLCLQPGKSGGYAAAGADNGRVQAKPRPLLSANELIIAECKFACTCDERVSESVKALCCGSGVWLRVMYANAP